VLLVEDSPDDIEFARRALERCELRHPLIVAEEGRQALGLLHGDGANEPLRPALVLLDLNIPGMKGREVLSRIKAHPELRTVPVVILTTSGQPTDVRECYEAGANAYHRKPHDFQEYQNTMREIVRYWLSSVVAAGI